MTTVLARRPRTPERPVQPRRGLHLPAWTIPTAAVLAVLARLPFLSHAPGRDEAGFLMVGAQWKGAGTSLYDGYFVDRPPLLITIFRFASLLGGIPALRVIGCLAVVAVVVGCARVAALVRDETAGRWAAVAAAALCVSPRLGGYEVNGELLAAPFVVLGLLAVVSALKDPTPRSGDRWMLVAGASGACALLVKQNFADVAVFAVVALLVAAIRADVSWSRVARLAGSGLLGAALATGVVAVWTMLHGTSLHGVYEAMYPFRLQAAHVLSTEGQGHAASRFPGLVEAAVVSGLAVLMVAALLGAARRRRDTFTVPLVALLAFATASALLGGNYWHHYLVGIIVPVSVLGGVLASRSRGPVRWATGWIVVASVVGWVGMIGAPHGTEAQAVGGAIASVAHRDDTIVTLYGQPDIDLASGLSSPYAQLWSLPTKTLDPHLTSLDTVLAGRDRPTWLVTGTTVRSWGLQTAATSDLIAHEYRSVGRLCGRTIYLRDGARREAPQLPQAPSAPSTCRAQALGPIHQEPRT